MGYEYSGSDHWKPFPIPEPGRRPPVPVIPAAVSVPTKHRRKKGVVIRILPSQWASIIPLCAFFLVMGAGAGMVIGTSQAVSIMGKAGDDARKTILAQALPAFSSDGTGIPNRAVSSAIKNLFLGRRAKGVASWYGPGFHGRKTSNGEVYSQFAWTVASKEFPSGSFVLIENPINGKTCVARVNDYGPVIDGRTIDVSWTVANQLEMLDIGVCPVYVIPFSFDDLEKIMVRPYTRP
jgi:hypothetical protein